MATGNSSYTRIITQTLQNHGTEIFNAVAQNNAFLYMLQKRENIKIVRGGRTFTHPIRFANNASFKMYGKLDPIDTPIPDNLTRAEYQIKVAAGSLVISTLEEAQNSGDREKLIDLIEFCRMDAEDSMANLLGAQVFATGTNSNDFGGLALLINSSPSTQSDVGGINPSTSGNTYWRNIVGSPVTAFNTSNEGVTAMNALMTLATFGRFGPTAVFTTKTVYNLYELSMTSNIRYQSTELSTGDTKFLHLAYGTLPVLFDDNCTTDVLYMVDMDSLWLQVLAQGNNRITSFEPSHNQLSRTALMYLFGNLTCGSRRTQGYLSVTG